MSWRALVTMLLLVSLALPDRVAAVAWAPSPDLVVGEVVTGGAKGADEYVELYNAGASSRDLSGLELVYVSASGKSITRKQQWSGGTVPAGGRLLLANADGSFAAAADHTYSGGLSATGGSVVLRVQDGSVVDALSWGTAASEFVEGAPAAAPPAGSSVERRPGDGGANSRDTNDNAADTRINPTPSAEGTSGPAATPKPTPAPTPKPTPPPTPKPTSRPTPKPTPTPAPTLKPTPAPTPKPTVQPTPTPSPGATPAPTAAPTPAPTQEPTPAPTVAPTPRPTPRPSPDPTPPGPSPTARPTAEPTPHPTSEPSPPPTDEPTPAPTAKPSPTAPPPNVLDIVAARARPVGTAVTVQGAVTVQAGRILGERTLVLQDASGGLAVRLPHVDLVADYPRGTIVRATGTLAEPYGNLELRPPDEGDLEILGSGGLPAAAPLDTGGLKEANEGLFATLTATVDEIDRYDSGAVSIGVSDSNGSSKVYAFAPVGLPSGGLEKGQRVRATGIVGQRSSSSGAADGYRLWIRGAADLEVLAGPPSPAPTPTPAPGGGDSGDDRPRRVRIAEAAEGETVIIVGVVTSKAGLIDPEGRRVTVQDSSGAILVRYPPDTDPARVGSFIRAVGEVGTWYGARQLETDKKPRRKSARAVQGTRLTRPPAEADEWRLVRVSVRITDVERDGDTWRAEAELHDGSSLPIIGLAASGIDGETLEPGRSARITGLVKRAHPSATDQRFGVAPRSPQDIRLGRLAADVDGEGDDAEESEDDRGSGIIAWAGGDGRSVFAATFGALDGLEDRIVRVGGRVEAVEERRLTLDDGTARGTLRLADTIGRVDPEFRVGEVVNAVGRVQRHRARGTEVVVASVADVRRAASLAGVPTEDAGVVPYPVAGDPGRGATAEAVATDVPTAGDTLTAPVLLVAGACGLLAAVLLAAAGLLYWRASRVIEDSPPERITSVA